MTVGGLPVEEGVAPVSDDELVYRRIRYGKNDYAVADGVVRVSSTAFGDRSGHVSVDRATLRRNDPIPTQDGDPKHAVVVIAVAEVRRIAAVRQQDEKKRPFGPEYLFDVFAAPIRSEPINLAHAEVRPSPDYCEGAVSNVKAKLEKALARIVGEELAGGRWAIDVYELRPASSG